MFFCCPKLLEKRRDPVILLVKCGIIATAYVNTLETLQGASTLTIHIAYVENDQLHQFTFEQIATVLKAGGIDNTLHIYPTQLAAINHLPYERPDIVFVNLRMRNGRHTAGLDIVRALRHHPLCQTTAIIGMAEYAVPVDNAAALAAGCHGFVPLPARLQEVKNVILSLYEPSAT
jgi:CheY-like chemotaxis protein